MTRGVDCASAHDTLTEVARRMRAMDVGAMPVCSGDEQPVGVISDRDIVVSCVAAGRDPSTTAVGEVMDRTVVTVHADANLHAAVRAMVEHRVRRLSVVDERGLVGIVALCDLAPHLSGDGLRQLLEVLSHD
jgi:CBS domain-containing protein